MGTSYFNVDDIAAGGPRQETILDVQIGNYGRPDLHFADGNRLSLNVTNTRTLGRAYGTDSKDWIDKIIELYVGEIETKDGKQNSVLIRPVSPTKILKPRSEPQSQAVDKDLNDDVPF
jgi:hypothetical protein